MTSEPPARPETTVDDLVPRVRAAIDQKLRTAVEAIAASQGALWWLDIEEGDAETATVWSLIGIDTYSARASKAVPMPVLQHMADNNPADVLRECAADVKIIEHITDQWDQSDGKPEPILPPEWRQVLLFVAERYRIKP